MRATTSEVARATRKRAIQRIAALEGIAEEVVIGSIEAGHRRHSAAFDALVCAGIEAMLTLAAQGRIELVTEYTPGEHA
jgi:hypothetical protein